MGPQGLQGQYFAGGFAGGMGQGLQALAERRQKAREKAQELDSAYNWERVKQILPYAINALQSANPQAREFGQEFMAGPQREIPRTMQQNLSLMQYPEQREAQIKEFQSRPLGFAEELALQRAHLQKMQEKYASLPPGAIENPKLTLFKEEEAIKQRGRLELIQERQSQLREQAKGLTLPEALKLQSTYEGNVFASPEEKQEMRNIVEAIKALGRMDQKTGRFVEIERRLRTPQVRKMSPEERKERTLNILQQFGMEDMLPLYEELFR